MSTFNEYTELNLLGTTINASAVDETIIADLSSISTTYLTTYGYRTATFTCSDSYTPYIIDFENADWGNRTSGDVLIEIPFYDSDGTYKVGLAMKIQNLSSYVAYDGTRYIIDLRCGITLNHGSSFVTNTDYAWGYVSIPGMTSRFILLKQDVNNDPSIAILGYYVQNGLPYQITSSLNRIVSLEQIENLYSASPNYAEFSPDYGEPSDEEGYSGGSFDDSSDQIDIPTMPTVGLSNAGFVNVYEVSNAQLTGFGAELFPSFSMINMPTITTPSDAADAVYQAALVLSAIGQNIPGLIDQYINQGLINFVLDCHIIPVAPTTSGSANIEVSWKTFNTTGNAVTSDYVDFDCGSLSISEYYSNYADYMTKAKLFLPFVGFVEIEPEYWQDGTLSITYRFNVIDGTFMAYVLSTSSKSKLTSTVIGQYGGACCVHIPITGENYANMANVAVTSAASMVMSGVAGGVKPPTGLGTGEAALTVASSVADIASNRPTVQSSNGYSGSSGFLSGRTPYLLIERPVADFSKFYPEENGLPANITATLSNLSGFTIATNLIFSGITATEPEMEMIKAAFMEGVIL